jgi:pimeloyl-ACP methyl ester carboxylesterase
VRSSARVDAVLAAHRARLRPFTAAGVGSGVLDAGEPGAPAVVCLHGVPASAFLYRKVVGELASRGLRGLAFDLAGLGVADRPDPAEFDYSWTGLGRFAAAAVDALALDRFHLVVHDVGGPVGFELTARMPERVLSLTLLNTLVAVESFRRPWVMEPLAHRGIGRLWLAAMQPRLFVMLMRRLGIEHQQQVDDAELVAYLRLLREGDGRNGDGGRAFVAIMRGFERTAEKQELYLSVVGDMNRPRQVLWGAADPALPLRPLGELAASIAGVDLRILPGRHFLQEDNAPAIADAVATLAAYGSER